MVRTHFHWSYFKSISKKKQIVIGTSLLVLSADWFTKALAVALLEEQSRIVVSKQWLVFQLTYNETGIGTGFRKLLEREHFGVGNAALASSVFTAVILLAASSWFYVKSPFLRGLAVLLGCCAALFAFYVSFELLPSFDTSFDILNLSNGLFYLASIGLLLWFTRNRGFIWLVAFSLGASVANMSNFHLHPKGVVDFIWVPAYRSMGIANVADYVIQFSRFGLLFWTLLYVVARLSNRFSEKPWPQTFVGKQY